MSHDITSAPNHTHQVPRSRTAESRRGSQRPCQSPPSAAVHHRRFQFGAEGAVAGSTAEDFVSAWRDYKDELRDVALQKCDTLMQILAATVH
jgi:hypothetical protein